LKFAVIIRPGQPEWTLVDQHFDRLLDLPEDEWEAYLAGVESEQPAIAQALREMLTSRRHLQSKGFLETSVLAMAAHEEVGTQLGPYTIRSLIGRGGMGEVWLAQRSDGRFEGQFAVKFLDSYTASAAALDRFRREGSLLARLTHEHIARLIDAGVSAAGRPYLILEYVQGEPIDQYCSAHSLSIEGRVHLLLDVLAALAHAHSNLVIHRDIKPSNILVTADGQIKLLDFGIAKLLSADPDTGDEQQLTRMEDSAFTPEFAAPEQILGEMPSTATDVYQVGVLMFRLLSGRLPLQGSGATRAERIKSALHGEPPRLSDVAPASSRKALRGDLDAIVSKALRKLPQERYATAAALADDLRRYLGHEPVAARANLVGYRVRKFVRRYRAAVIGSSAAVLALMAATAFALFQMRQAQIERDQVRAQAKRAERQAEFVTLMMSTVGNKPTTAEQLVDAGSRLVGEHYTGDPEFRVSAMLNLSARYADLGLTQKQLAILNEANQIAHQLNDATMIARSECGISEAEIDLGHLDRAASLVASGSAGLSHASSPDPLFVEDCMEAQADVLDAQGNPGEATQVAEKALALLQQADAIHDVRYSSLLGRIADYYKEAGDSHKGFEYVERALAAAGQNGLGDTDATMTAIHNEASSLMNFGEVKAACAHEKDLVDRLEATGRSVITAMTVLYGTCQLREGRPADALSWYDKGVKSAQGEDDVSLQIYAGQNRARALMELHRYPEASAQLDLIASLAKEHKLLGMLVPNRALVVRADLLMAQGHNDEAQRILEPLIQMGRDPKSGQGYLLAPALLRSAKIALAQGRNTDAATLAAELLREDERRARDPAASADVGEALLLLARCKHALNDEPSAHSTAQQAVISLTAALGADNPLTRDALALQ
jgi:eukaryotic-like serine/threonine-protein kinase